MREDILDLKFTSFHENNFIINPITLAISFISISKNLIPKYNIKEI
jgi:hypothetical protein